MPKRSFKSFFIVSTISRSSWIMWDLLVKQKKDWRCVWSLFLTKEQTLKSLKKSFFKPWCANEVTLSETHCLAGVARKRRHIKACFHATTLNMYASPCLQEIQRAQLWTRKLMTWELHRFHRISILLNEMSVEQWLEKSGKPGAAYGSSCPRSSWCEGEWSTLQICPPPSTRAQTRQIQIPVSGFQHGCIQHTVKYCPARVPRKFENRRRNGELWT